MYVALMNVYYGIKAYIDMFARKYPRHLLSSEICAQNQGNAISEDPKFKNFPGERALGTPRPFLVKSASGARLSIR